MQGFKNQYGCITVTLVSVDGHSNAKSGVSVLRDERVCRTVEDNQQVQSLLKLRHETAVLVDVDKPSSQLWAWRIHVQVVSLNKMISLPEWEVINLSCL